MKAAIVIIMTVALALLPGCLTSPRGGSAGRDEGFKIGVSSFTTEVKQGQLQVVTVTLQKDSLFKDDVRLQIRASKGIGVTPSDVRIKASEKPEVQLQIAAPKDAPIGEYPVVVKGTPDHGESTSVGFTVKVVAP